jgi:hypothetical protein
MVFRDMEVMKYPVFQGAVSLGGRSVPKAPAITRISGQCLAPE